MAYKLEDILKENDFSLDRETNAILDWLAEMWDIEAAPKGYAEFMKDYRENQGIEELEEQEEDLLKSFKGHGNSTTLSYPFVIGTSLPHVAYEAKNQVRRGPLEVLIRNLIIHCVLIGKRLAELNKKSEPWHRISCIHHAFLMSDNTDKEIGHTYELELKAYFDSPDTSVKEILQVHENMRKEIHWERFIKSFCQYTKKCKKFVTYMGTDDKTLKKFFGYIHGETGSENRFRAFTEKMLKEYNTVIEKDGQYAFKIFVQPRKKKEKS